MRSPTPSGRHRHGLDLHRDIVAGVGIPSSKKPPSGFGRVARDTGIPVIADGGINIPATSPRRKVAAGAECAMVGSLPRRHDETAGPKSFLSQAAPTRTIAAWDRCAPWRAAGRRYSSRTVRTSSSSCRKGVEARCPTRQRRATVRTSITGGLRAAMGLWERADHR